jgi:HK97 family phage prohead protease
MPPTAYLDNAASAYRPKAIKEDRLVIEYREMPLHMKAATDENLFDAWFATWDGPDRAGDIIQKGAFANLEDFRRAGYILHDHKGPEVGYPLEVVQDNVGLRVIGKWHDTVAAKECRNVVSGRLASGLDAFGSIGYKTLASQPTFIDGRSCKLITKLNLYECSFTSLPCNPSARVIAAKGDDWTLAEFKQWWDYQRKSGRAISRANLKVIKDVYDSLRGVKDSLSDFLLQFVPEDDSELLLTAREDHSNTVVDDDASQQAIESRPRNTYSPEDRAYASGKAPRGPGDPRTAAGNVIPGVGSPTADLMERGKSGGLTRPQALEQMRKHDEVRRYIDGLGGKSGGHILDDLAGLPPKIRDLEITHALLEGKRAFLLEQGHTKVAPSPLGWGSPRG